MAFPQDKEDPRLEIIRDLVHQWDRAQEEIMIVLDGEPETKQVGGVKTDARCADKKDGKHDDRPTCTCGWIGRGRHKKGCTRRSGASAGVLKTYRCTDCDFTFTDTRDYMDQTCPSCKSVQVIQKH